MTRLHEGYSFQKEQDQSINYDKIRNKMMQQVAASWRDHNPDGFTAYLDKSDLTTEQRAELESAK